MPGWYPDEDPKLTLRKWVVDRYEEGWSMWRICRERRLPQSTVHRWLRWAEEGRELTDRKRGRRAGVRPVTGREDVVHEVAVMRNSWRWGPRKITRELRRQDLRLAEGSVYAIMKREDLNEPLPRPRRKHAYIRFEREHSNSMWQTDWKQIDADHWLTAYLDDHSRFVPGAVITEGPTTAASIALLEDCVTEWGTPREILTGHDVQYTAMRGGTSAFDTRLEELGIKHILAAVRRPTTTGKIERWWGTYDQEGDLFENLDDFLFYYNQVRPHQSLDYEKPLEVFLADLP